MTLVCLARSLVALQHTAVAFLVQGILKDLKRFCNILTWVNITTCSKTFRKSQKIRNLAAPLTPVCDTPAGNQ
jgi:hypothetical protein